MSTTKDILLKAENAFEKFKHGEWIIKTAFSASVFEILPREVYWKFGYEQWLPILLSSFVK